MKYLVNGAVLNEVKEKKTVRFLFWNKEITTTERHLVFDFTLTASSRAEMERLLQNFTDKWTHIRIYSIKQV